MLYIISISNQKILLTIYIEGKMKTIGLRVTPKIIYFCVIEIVNDEANICIADKIIVPVALDVPDKLSFIRTLFYTIINQYEVDNAVIRRIEDNAQKIDVNRANLEGVLQELISNCRIKKYKTCKLSQLSVLLKCRTKEIKECVYGDKIFNITDWDEYKKEEKESILCALAATEL